MECLPGAIRYDAHRFILLPSLPLQDKRVGICKPLSSQLGDLLCLLCPLLAQLTLDNVVATIDLLSSMTPLQHFSVLDVLKGASIWFGRERAFLALESLSHINWHRPLPRHIQELSHAPNLRSAHFDEVPLDGLPNAILASLHPSADVRVDAITTVEHDMRVVSWDVLRLASCLREGRAFEWAGTFIVTRFPRAEDLEAYHKMSDLFSRVGQGAKKLILRQDENIFTGEDPGMGLLDYSVDDVLSLAQAVPHQISELEIREWQFGIPPHVLASMLEVWPVGLLTLHYYAHHVAVIEPLRSMKANGSLVPKASILRVRVMYGAIKCAFPVLEFTL